VIRAALFAARAACAGVSLWAWALVVARALAWLVGVPS
jgi:hypothetical protein